MSSALEVVVRNRTDLAHAALEHLLLVGVATALAAAIGVPIGIALTRWRRLRHVVVPVANALQTIPSLALFGLLIPVLGAHGIGRIPALIALFLYALLPIIQNTLTGIEGVDPAVREAGRGMGMTDGQLLMLVELPLALGVIAAGVRVATVISVGTATIAAAIGAGGLGTFIFRGLRMNDMALVLLGSIPAALMALGADLMLGLLAKRFGARSRGGEPRRSKALALGLAGAAIAIVALAAVSRESGGAGRPRFVVASKDFSEQVLLGELIAQAAERTGEVDVVRQFELAGDLAHRALVSGEVDAYVEYTGTALVAILKSAPSGDRAAVLAEVRRAYASKWGLEWLEPLGFDNTFAILVRGDDARRLRLTTISDLVARASSWRAGFGQDFLARPDGYDGFVRAYALRFAAAPIEMDLSLLYRALANRQVDVIAGNATDGLIDALDLVQLRDDRHYFPPYEAVPVVRKPVLEAHPRVRAALEKLAGRVSAADMRRLNHAVDGEHRSPRDLVREFLDTMDRTPPSATVP